MATPALDSVEMPLGNCPVCHRQVLAYLDGDDGDEIRRCLECDGVLTDWREVAVDELEAAGYAVLEARGCGNGGGCSAGGCGARR